MSASKSNDSDESLQLRLWRGDFGKAYIERNDFPTQTLAALTRAWAGMLLSLRPQPMSILEVGANVGLNLKALSRITTADLYAVEPNELARQRMVDDCVVPASHVFDGFAANLPFVDKSIDLVFTSGVLIHIDPADLAASCSEIFRVSRRYVLCAEYFSAEERAVTYRGLQDQLFTRDFGKFWMDLKPELRLLDYGFIWRGEAGLDNITWWIFERSAI